MGSWRRQLGEIRHQDLKNTRSRNRKPPLGSGCFNVPSWEKQFCASVGSVPWRKLLDTKKCMYLYDNVVKWDDSAGEEAFHNAKRRFWAKLNGLPCNISLPDPDIYIDEVDWDSNIDPDLFMDLERETNQPICGDENEILSSLGNALGLNQSFWCTGWGEAEEGQKGIFPSGDEYENGDSHLDIVENSQERGCSRDEEGWNNCWNQTASSGRKNWENENNKWGIDIVENSWERGCSRDEEGWNNCWNQTASSGRKNWENENNKWGNDYELWEDGVRDEARRRCDSNSWNKGWDGGWRQLELNSWNQSSDQYNDSSIKDHRKRNTWGMNRRGGRKMVNFSNGPYRPVSHRV